MSDEELLELAQRCEGAMGPDLDLDSDIKAVLFPPNCARAPLYTGSIDAAMKLVPEEWLVLSLSQIAGDGMAFCELVAPFDGKSAIGVAKEMQTALCAAALRARAAIESSSHLSREEG